VTVRNDEKDYTSARTASYITLVCNLIALIFGGIVTLTIFIVVLVYVIQALMNLSENNTSNNFNSFDNNQQPNFFNY